MSLMNFEMILIENRTGCHFVTEVVGALVFNVEEVAVGSGTEEETLRDGVDLQEIEKSVLFTFNFSNFFKHLIF